METIDNWIIIELTEFVISGKIAGFNIYTDKILLIKDNYAVTQTTIYKLNTPDKVWITTKDAKEKIELFS